MDQRLEKDYEEKVHAPFTDSLTGLFNRGFFQISLDREVERSHRYGQPFTVALITIDFLFEYNKRCGYVEGDIVLRKVAGIIMEKLRQIDLPARYVGDKISVILIKIEAKQAFMVMERIRQAVEVCDESAPTVSIGLASFPRDDTTVEGVMDKAKKASMQATIEGGNRICFFDKKATPLDWETKPRILVVDDNPRNLKLMGALLLPLNCEVISAANGKDALAILHKIDVNLILLDIMMPVMDGYEVCRRLKQSEATRLIPIIMVTALNDMDSKVKGIKAGTDDFITKPPNKIELLARSRSLLKMNTLNRNLTSIENVLISMANAVESKDSYTQGHILRVADMAVELGGKMGITQKEKRALKFGSILHDIGKIGIPREILNKPGPLSPEEWNIVKTHPDEGYKICLPLQKTLGPAVDVIRYHHEKIDGSGYPDGLTGEQIPLAARIMAVVDIYDALVTDRPYRKAMAKEKAFGILQKEADDGKLEKEIVTHFIEMIATAPPERKNGCLKQTKGNIA